MGTTRSGIYISLMCDVGGDLTANHFQMNMICTLLYQVHTGQLSGHIVIALALFEGFEVSE